MLLACFAGRRRRPARRAALTARAAGGDSPPLAVRDLGEKGQGVVAARRIRRGELILEEAPVLTVRRLDDLGQLPAWSEEIREELDKCSEEQQAQFWSLADVHAQDGSKTVAGVVRTNGLPVDLEDGVERLGIYGTVSRFNHSCGNNVHNAWQADRKLEALHALRDVEAGEELCITYIDIFQERCLRRQELLQTFKFSCGCPVCSLPQEQQEASDRARFRLRQLREVLPQSQGLAPQVVQKMAELIDQELQGNPAAKMWVYHFAFGMYQDLPDGGRDQAKVFAQLALNECLVAEGQESWLSQALKSYLQS